MEHEKLTLRVNEMLKNLLILCFIGLSIRSSFSTAFGADISDLLSDWIGFLYDLSPDPHMASSGYTTLPVLIQESPGGFWNRKLASARIGFAKIQSVEDVRSVAAINHRFFETLKMRDNILVLDRVDHHLDNQNFYYYFPGRHTVENSEKAASFWAWFQKSPEKVLDSMKTASEFHKMVDLAGRDSKQRVNKSKSAKRAYQSATAPSAKTPCLEIHFPRPLPTDLPGLASKPNKALDWQNLSVVNLIQGNLVSAEDASLRQLAKYSRHCVLNREKALEKLPPYNPNAKTAQPGDIFVRTGRFVTIPHGGNYWGLVKSGELHYDAIELRRDSADNTYIVPMHWTADKGPNLNFYRPLESEIPCLYKGKQRTLKNLPLHIKEALREKVWQLDHARLGSTHGDYKFVGVFRTSNQCIDSLLEPWDKASKIMEITITDNQGNPIEFRDHFRLLNTANPMSWPAGFGIHALRERLPKVDPPHYRPNQNTPSPGSFPASNNEAGISMHTDLKEGSFNKHHHEKLDALRDHCIKKKTR